MRENPCLRLSLRVVFYREDGAWVAHCLETDLAGVGETRREAMASLWDATEVQLEASLESDNPANFFHPAEGQYFSMYARGRDMATAELAISSGRLEGFVGEIDDVAGRVYANRDELASI